MFNNSNAKRWYLVSSTRMNAQTEFRNNCGCVVWSVIKIWLIPKAQFNLD